MVRQHLHIVTAALVFASAAPALARAPAVSVTEKFRNPAMPMLVVAHRACHNPAPRHGMFASNPENSVSGIERCIELGVDVAEIDIRRTRDGYLVLMHDETVDRTTDGHGNIADMTLAEIRLLRLRENEGGKATILTDQNIPTLEEALRVAKGRILLNLDVQAGLYGEVVATVRRASQEDGVILKQPAGIGSTVLADMPPFDTVPFQPMLRGNDDLPLVARRQLEGKRLPVALEVPRIDASTLSAIVAIANRSKVRVWVNSLWEGYISGVGGDIDALRDPDKVWGSIRRAGASVIQTDEPEALLRFLGR